MNLQYTVSHSSFYNTKSIWLLQHFFAKNNYVIDCLNTERWKVSKQPRRKLNFPFIKYLFQLGLSGFFHGLTREILTVQRKVVFATSETIWKCGGCGGTSPPPPISPSVCADAELPVSYKYDLPMLVYDFCYQSENRGTEASSPFMENCCIQNTVWCE